MAEGGLLRTPRGGGERVGGERGGECGGDTVTVEWYGLIWRRVFNVLFASTSERSTALRVASTASILRRSPSHLAAV